LLANKGERGRKKLADKWEATPYTVVALNPQCHTYRIRNTHTGQEKTVHRNLLLQANFLPIEVEEVEPSFSDSSEPADNCSGVALSDAVTSMSECSNADRTASWVAGTVAPNDSRCSTSSKTESDPPLTVDPEPAQSVFPATQEEPLDCDNVSDHSSEGGLTSNTVISASVGDSVDIQTSYPVESLPNKVVTQVRTRFGRLVKPMNRLIQNMTQNMKTSSSVNGVTRSLLT
ncbi:MAG: hypothetical protein ACRCVE_10885, partial [Plesiomonas sp.]